MSSFWKEIVSLSVSALQEVYPRVHHSRRYQGNLTGRRLRIHQWRAPPCNGRVGRRHPRRGRLMRRSEKDTEIGRSADQSLEIVSRTPLSANSSWVLPAFQ
jgi:hypothetical protein